MEVETLSINTTLKRSTKKKLYILRDRPLGLLL